MKKVAILLLVLLSACVDDGEKKVSGTDNQNTSLKATSECPEHLLSRKMDNLNISILLDLSSRIDEPNQQHNDSSYIVSISKVFNEHIKTKKLGLLKDRLQLHFHPTPSNVRINKLSEELKISYVKGVSKNEWIGKTDSLYQLLPSEIYELAREDFQEKGKYPGSDIWRFFKDDVDDYAIDICYRNIVIILTDGYMFYEATQMEEGNRTSYLTPISLGKMPLTKGNWSEILAEKNYGFIAEREDLDDLEVLVIGIQSLNPNNPHAPDIIRTYWEQWFEEMGVKNSKVKKADIPSNVEKVINDFINID